MPFTSTAFATPSISVARPFTSEHNQTTVMRAAAPSTMKTGPVFSKKAPTMSARMGQTKMQAIPNTQSNLKMTFGGQNKYDLNMKQKSIAARSSVVSMFLGGSFAPKGSIPKSSVSFGAVNPSFSRGAPVTMAAWNQQQVEVHEAQSKKLRLKHLEDQAMDAIKKAVESGAQVVFPNAMIAGDCVITHLLGRLGYLSDKKIPVLFVDTLHLFPETLELMDTMESNYNFKGYVTMAEGIKGARGAESKAMYDKVYGADLWKTDISEYDRLCKVEPF